MFICTLAQNAMPAVLYRYPPNHQRENSDKASVPRVPYLLSRALFFHLKTFWFKTIAHPYFQGKESSGWDGRRGSGILFLRSECAAPGKGENGFFGFFAASIIPCMLQPPKGQGPTIVRKVSQAITPESFL